VVTKEQAIKIATEHTAQVPLDHPDYRMNFELTGSLGDEWLFEYLIECLKDIPLEKQELFAGAGGFVVSSTGQVRGLTVPMFSEAEQLVNTK